MTNFNFEEFFHSLHGYNPFPWQSRLMETVLTRGWPEVIAVPTSAGKTACMDIALFHLLSQAEDSERIAPRRIFHIIDRRIVVDEAYDRARRIEARLTEALKGPPGMLKEAAKRLAALSGGSPLKTAILRGGLYREDGWAGSPDQPLIAVSTVDQVGSRLLFRGYGLSSYQAPIHAALLANDALLLVDEAHLSQPFVDTLKALDRYRYWADALFRTPWKVVRLTATPEKIESGFREDEADFDHPVLKPRFVARKMASLYLVKCETAKVENLKAKREIERANRENLVDAIVAKALSLATGESVRVVGVVVNRVATARKVHENLMKEEQGEAVLLTGRSRPFDRDRLLERLLPRIAAGRDRKIEKEGVLFVVATQCIEVGANLDFDALVTECASLDAIRQRFGRLDRLGQLGNSSAFVVAREDQVAPKAPDDPVYGPALKATWWWLQSKTQTTSSSKKRKKSSNILGDLPIDFGIAAMRATAWGDDEINSLLPPRVQAPIMLPAHLDLWVQTHPIPAADPDPAFWLHGPRTGPADCQLIWRADLDPERQDDWVRIVAINPPSSAEALPVPIQAAKSWLKSLDDVDFSDQEGATGEQVDERGKNSSFQVLVWRGPDESAVCEAQALRPGDTLIVPALYGGMDDFGWNPGSKKPVRDIADPVAYRQRGRPILRIHPGVMTSWFDASMEIGPVMESLLESVVDEEAELADVMKRLVEWASERTDLQGWVLLTLQALNLDGRKKMFSYPDNYKGTVIIGRRGIITANIEGNGDDFTTQDNASIFTNRVTLSQHAIGVRDRCRLLATHNGYPLELAEDLALAGYFHDIGKGEHRFQILLFGGDEVAEALADEPLAKSDLSFRNFQAYTKAREIACLPKGWRHELLSTVLLEGNPEAIKPAHDQELVLHLIAAHHGRCRPFAPINIDPNPKDIFLSFMGASFTAQTNHGLERLDSGVSDRFWKLVRRYGWFGLAMLEAIVRLADHQVSSEEELGLVGREIS